MIRHLLKFSLSTGHTLGYEPGTAAHFLRPKAETIPNTVRNPGANPQRLETSSPELIYLKINRLTLCLCGLDSVVVGPWEEKDRGSIDYSYGLHNFFFSCLSLSLLYKSRPSTDGDLTGSCKKKRNETEICDSSSGQVSNTHLLLTAARQLGRRQLMPENKYKADQFDKRNKKSILKELIRPLHDSP